MDEAAGAIIVFGALVVALALLDTGGSEAASTYRIETFVYEAAAAAAEEVLEESEPPSGGTAARWPEIEAAFEQAALVAVAGVCLPADGDWATIALVDTGSGERWPWSVVATVSCIPSSNVFGQREPVTAIGVESVRWGQG